MNKEEEKIDIKSELKKADEEKPLATLVYEKLLEKLKWNTKN